MKIDLHRSALSAAYNPGVGEGEGDGEGEGRSDGGTTAGFGLSGDECKWIAFHAVPTRLNTRVILPETLSGVPL